MKKFFGFFVAITLVLSMTFVSVAEAKTGDVIGKALHTDIVAYINHYAIPSYAVNGQSCIVAEDLRNFGFDVVWDGNARSLTIYKNYAVDVAEMSVKKEGAPGTIFAKTLETDIVVYANGNKITSYAINGYTMIPIEELWMFGEVYWVEWERAIKLWVDDLNIRESKQEVKKHNGAISWRDMLGTYISDNGNLNTLYLSEKDGEPYALMATYRGGADSEGGLYVMDDGTLYYFNGGMHQYYIKFLSKDKIQIYGDTMYDYDCTFTRSRY